MKKIIINIFICLFYSMALMKHVSGQTDTLNVMTYNVLNYGDACQGPNSTMRNYLKTIVGYVQPDVMGLVKMLPLKRFASDFNGYLPVDFADSMVTYVLNASGKKQYGYCSYTNEARGSDMNVLFYNIAKLGYIYTKVLTVNLTDFDLFKFYYKDSALVNSHDSTYLYFVLFHTASGDDPTVRNAQLTSTLNALKDRFTRLPNLIMMGDYNLRSSDEICYHQLVNSSDSNFQFYDPPFGFDHHFSYPASWDKNPLYSWCLTTSTRYDANIPNACGTNGGAKGWYDHMLFSSWMISGTNDMSYVPHSYNTIGNDGNRFGISVNDSTSKVKNVSAPDEVINAIFQLSNKYPVVSKIAVRTSNTMIRPPDPERYNTGISEYDFHQLISVVSNNPVFETLEITLTNLTGSSAISILLFDMRGKILINEIFSSDKSKIQMDVHELLPSVYYICVTEIGTNRMAMKKIVKLK